MAQIFLAKQSAITQLDGRTITIRRGVTSVEEGHELLARLPHLFEPVADRVQYRVEPVVETARQEPAAPRGRGRRRGKQGESDDTPETTPEGTGETTPEGTPEGTGEGTDEAAPEGTGETTPEDTPEGTGEAAPESTGETTTEGD